MLRVDKIYPIGFAANSYLVSADGVHAVAVDPAQPRILAEAARRGLTVTHVLLTHGHFDHIGGCAALQRAGAKVGCLEAERGLVLGRDNLADLFASPVEPFRIDFTLTDGEVFEADGVRLRAIATPGHTAGSACYLAEGILFTGDTLFADGAGRTDLPTGSEAALRASLQRLYALDGDDILYTGHGEDSTLARERLHKL